MNLNKPIREEETIRQNTGVLDRDLARDEENEPETEIINGETTAPGAYGKTSGGMPKGTPPAGQQARNPEGTTVEDTGS